VELGPGEPATLELLDVSGRRIASWRALAPSSGATTLVLGDTAALAPGVYLLRLTRAGERVGARVCVLD
jgi:hypothetical protein